MKQVSISNKAVTDYWLEFYIQDSFCSLCGNNGIIDTTGIKTPNGNLIGRKNFCICPNGQAIRKEAINSSKDRKILPS